MQELEKVTNQFKNEKAAHDMLKGKYKEVSISMHVQDQA